MKYRTRTYYTDGQKALDVGATEGRLEAPPDCSSVQSRSYLGLRSGSDRRHSITATEPFRHTLSARRRYRGGADLDTQLRSSGPRPVDIECFSERGAIGTGIASRLEVLFDIGGHVPDGRYCSPQLLGSTAVLVRPFANRVGLSDVDARDRGDQRRSRLAGRRCLRFDHALILRVSARTQDPLHSTIGASGPRTT